MNAPVVVMGDVTIDIVAAVESYPPPGGDVQPLHTRLAVGGTSLNTAVMLARLGIDTALVARIGPDFLGDHVLAQMERIGLTTRWIQRDRDIMTGLVYIAVTPDGQRTMLGGAGANRNLAAPAQTLDLIAHAQWLHVTSYNVLATASLDATHRALGIAQASSVATSLDVGLAPCRLAPGALNAVAAQVQLVLPSDDSDFTAGPGKTVVRKRGAAGCVIATPQGAATIPALVVDVLDSTGAGDAFDAGLIAGRIWGLDLSASGLLANACGAAACTVLGAGDAFPPREVVVGLLQRGVPAGWQARAAQVLSVLAAHAPVSAHAL